MLNPEGKVGYSPSGFGHPTCLNNPNPRRCQRYTTPERISAEGSGAEPLPVGSAEHNVEGTGENARFGRRVVQRYDEPGAGGGIANSHQDTVTLV